MAQISIIYLEQCLYFILLKRGSSDHQVDCIVMFLRPLADSVHVAIGVRHNSTVLAESVQLLCFSDKHINSPSKTFISVSDNNLQL
jgi:hypothetical protein